jgi:uridine phosphorylase
MTPGARKRSNAGSDPPILESPGRGAALIEPCAILARKPRVPARCVLCFFHDVIRHRAATGDLELLMRLRGEGEPISVYRLARGGEPVTVAWPGVGAPFAAANLEELIALGGRMFVCAGGAGVLDGSIPVGHVVVPTAALRAEGTSYHYQRRGRFSRPHPLAVRAIRRACRDAGVDIITGATWTTDAVYRETPAMIRRRRAEGCITVEMEAAAFFAVARFRGVVLGQLLYAGDDLSGETWDHRNWTVQTDARQGLFDLAVAACRLIPPP